MHGNRESPRVTGGGHRQSGPGRANRKPATNTDGQSDRVVVPEKAANNVTAPGNREGNGGAAGGKDPGQGESE